MRIGILTAGGAGMFCGACMHDNTWARALTRAGCEVLLLPAYTPIRVDERNVSTRRVFLGGVNLYLRQRFGWWRKFPRAMTRWLDSPAILRIAPRLAISNDPQQLGDLTLAMLDGDHGPGAPQIADLARFLG